MIVVLVSLTFEQSVLMKIISIWSMNTLKWLINFFYWILFDNASISILFKFDNSSSKNSGDIRFWKQKQMAAPNNNNTQQVKGFEKIIFFFWNLFEFFVFAMILKLNLNMGFYTDQGWRKKNLVAVAAIKVILLYWQMWDVYPKHTLSWERDSFCFFACIFCLNEFFFL